MVFPNLDCNSERICLLYIIPIDVAEFEKTWHYSSMSCSVAVTDSRTDALIRLMDDPSVTVHKAILKELDAMGGDSAKELLRHAMHIEETQLSAELLWEELFGPIPEKQFERYIRESDFDLETAYILLSQIIDPGMNAYDVVLELDELADSIQGRMDEEMNDWERCRVLSMALFEDEGFCLNLYNSSDPLNWSIRNVLQTHEGHPVALCIVYALVALRCGMDMALIHMPGRFFLGCFSEGIPLYIDVTSSGEFRSQGELMNLLITEHKMPRADFFAPISVAEVLIQCCKDLALQYRISDHPKEAKVFSDYLKIFANRSYH